MDSATSSHASDIARLLESNSKAKEEYITSRSTDSQFVSATSPLTAQEIATRAISQWRALQNTYEVIQYLEFLVQIRKLQQDVASDSALTSLQHSVATLNHVEHRIRESTLSQKGRVTLSEQVTVIQNNMRMKIQSVVSKSLGIKMAAEDWPMKEDRIAQTEFVSSFKAASSVYSNSHELPEILNVFQAIAEPLRTRFQYHFTSKRATNRLDKPEWALQHVLALAEQYEGFMANFVQPLLSEALPARGLVASHEFIHALLPMVTTKLQDNTSRLLEDKQLLTYTIAEVKRFDDTMRENFGLCSREGSYWKGVCNEILTKEVFEAWLTSEEDFSMERYHAIMDGVDVFEIVPDTEESTGEIAPNPSASRIIDLFEAMTKTFTPLEDLSQRRKFTQSIQVALLDTYRSRIVSSTDAFEALTSGFSGGFPTTDVAGNSGLQRLCRQLSGVSNVLSRLMDWVNDPYYVAIDDPDTHESCFDRQIQDYTLLKRRIETLIVNHLSNELTQDLRNYTRLQDWASSESQVATIAANSHTSSQLIRFYESIDSMFGYLATVASTVLIHRLYISLGQELDQVIYDSIIKRNEFSRRGALQLKRDILQMWWTFSPYVARPEAGMRSVAESLALLSDGKDSQEAAVLREVEIALDEKTRLSHSTRVEMLEAAGIVTMAPQAVRSLLQRKLYSIG